MPTKRTILAELTANELRASIDFYELAVADRRVKPQLVDALARSRRRGSMRFCKTSLESV